MFNTKCYSSVFKYWNYRDSIEIFKMSTILPIDLMSSVKFYTPDICQNAATGWILWLSSERQKNLSWCVILMSPNTLRSSLFGFANFILNWPLYICFWQNRRFLLCISNIKKENKNKPHLNLLITKRYSLNVRPRGPSSDS